jgi:hypothetical protein
MFKLSQEYFNRSELSEGVNLNSLMILTGISRQTLTQYFDPCKLFTRVNPELIVKILIHSKGMTREEALSVPLGELFDFKQTQPTR